MQNDGVVKINGWDTKTAKSVAEVSSYADDYDVLMRHHTAGKYQTEFINIAPLLSGSGSSAPTTTKEIEVITDISFSLDKTSYVPKLTATLTKKKIKVVDEEAVESTTANVITFSKQDFIQNTEYNQSDHKFYQDVREILVIPTKDYSLHQEVFEATPHSGG